MAKAAILVPYKEMCELTSQLIGNYSHITPVCVEYIQTEEIEKRAKALEQEGCELIIARGLHASKIKRCVKLPVVEIRVTAQELGGLVLELHQELGVECPKVGLIGFENTLCDTSRFDELFQMQLHRYAAEDCHNDYEVLWHLVEQAQKDGCEAILGGKIVCGHAAKLGIPYKFIPSGVESMQSAFALADQICYAIDMEKNNSAERNTMLDYTFSGIMQVDTDGIILRANRVTFNLLNIRPVNMIGSRVSDVLPQLEPSLIDKALQEGRESYAILVPIQNRTTVVNIAPIIIDDRITGGILTFQEGQRITEMDGELRRELYQMGFVASYTFDKLPAKSLTSQKLMKLARAISKYNAPVLLFGEDGVGKILDFELAGTGKEEEHGGLRHGVDRCGGSDGHISAVLSGGCYVYVVITTAVTGNALELGCTLKHLCGIGTGAGEDGITVGNILTDGGKVAAVGNKHLVTVRREVILARLGDILWN